MAAPRALLNTRLGYNRLDLRVNVTRTVKTLAALMPPIVLAVTVAIAGLSLARAELEPATLRDAGDVLGGHLQTLGTVYAVLLAFVVYAVWQQFNDARLAVEREANELVDLYRTAEGLPEAERAALQAFLRRYVDVVTDVEWAAMAAGDEKQMQTGAALLDDAWRELHPFDPSRECHKALYAEALARFNDLSDARSLRLTSARLRIPLALRLLLYFGAVVLTVTTYLMWVDSFALHATITGSLVAALTHVLYVVEDLDDCFDGNYQVPRQAFERARSVMRT